MVWVRGSMEMRIGVTSTIRCTYFAALSSRIRQRSIVSALLRDLWGDIGISRNGIDDGTQSLLLCDLQSLRIVIDVRSLIFRSGISF